MPRRKAHLCIDSYDCIGFDADHSLVKFNITLLHKLLVEGHLEELRKEEEEVQAMESSSGVRAGSRSWASARAWAISAAVW